MSWTIYLTVPTLPSLTSGSKLKEGLSGRKYTSVQDLSKAVFSECNAVSALEYQKCSSDVALVARTLCGHGEMYLDSSC